MERDRYELTIAGLTRYLPIVEVAPGLRIASFVMLGDTELVETVAEAIYEKPEFPRAEIELLVCPEAKAIALTHAIARRLGVDYVVARKSLKAYMREPLVEATRSITTRSEQLLAIDSADSEKLRARRVCVVDDVVSTGGSLASLERLLAKVPCTVVARSAALLEEGGASGEGLVYLERLPVFKSEPRNA